MQIIREGGHTPLPWKVVSKPNFENGLVYTSVQPVTPDPETMKPLAMADGSYHVCRMTHTAAMHKVAVHRANAELIVRAVNAYPALVEALEGPIGEIAAERQRQVEVEGWSPEHDDAHEDGELAEAAACYAEYAGKTAPVMVGDVRSGQGRPLGWPFSGYWWKPKDRRRDLIRAAALIVAEIERLDRAALALSARGDGS